MARRLFVAVDLPADCRDTLARLNPKLSGAPWQQPEQFHLTLSFLGDVEDQAKKRLDQMLPQAATRMFSLELRGLGTFGGHHLKVLWADIGGGRAELEALQAKVREVITHAGQPQDMRPFHPHVTLARLRNVHPPGLRSFLAEHEGQFFGRFRVGEFVLYSSEPGAQGPIYRALTRVPLQP